LPEVKGTCDFVGINYYSRLRVGFEPRSPKTLFVEISVPPHKPQGDSGIEVPYGEVYPEGLRQAATRAPVRPGAAVLEIIQDKGRQKTWLQQGGFPVVNPTESLTEMQRHLRGEHERFGCLGGHKYFYLDWNLNLYRCHFWEKPMCNIYEFDQSKLIRDGCTRCMIDCYRDPSVLQFVAISVSDAWNNLKKGKLLSAAKSVFDSRNLTSLKAVWEDRKWIGKV